MPPYTSDVLGTAARAPLDEEVPRPVAGDVVGHHFVVIEVYVGRPKPVVKTRAARARRLCYFLKAWAFRQKATRSLLRGSCPPP